MYDLYSSIFHQLSVYSASYAALPHLVNAAESTTDGEWRAQVLSLAGGIHAWHDPADLAAQPIDIVTWYRAAVPHALACSIETLGQPLTRNTAIYLLQGAAALAGHLGPGRHLDGFASDEFSPTCPGCERELYAWPDGDGLKVAATDPVRDKNARFIPVRAGLAKDSRFRAGYGWLVEQCGREAVRQLEPGINALFGVATCPACRATFPLFDAIVGSSP